MKTKLQETEKVIKDLILFDSAWNKRTKIQSAKKLPKEALKRIEVYRDLVKNSFTDLITKIYRNTHKLLHKNWKTLISKYIETYPPNSPILNKVAENFPLFLDRQKEIIKKYPFIHELALYEWLEVEVYERTGEPANRRFGEKNKGFVLNPIYEICKFKYPIPNITEKIEAGKTLGKVSKSPMNILIYRDPKTLNVRFNEISPGTLAYLELLLSGFSHEMVVIILAEHYKIKENDLDNFNKQINDMVKTLKERRILIS